MLDSSERQFRFYDNREKYLLFVSTCSEKQVIAKRVAMDIRGLRPGLQPCAYSTPAWATRRSSPVS